MSFGLWARSKSLRFAIDRHAKHFSASRPIHSFSWKGSPVYYRAGTCDIGIIDGILLKPDKNPYALPTSFEPNVILDFGGNIGAASLYFTCAFPFATIHSFEPIRENYDLMKKNLEPYKNVHSHQVAVGNTNTTLTFNFSDDPNNFGGFSKYDKGVNKSRTVSVECRKASDLLQELNIDKIDVIKADTEGSEKDILMDIPPELLRNTKYILGELHGNGDFELLSYLDQWFEIEISRTFYQRVYGFKAKNRALPLKH